MATHKGTYVDGYVLAVKKKGLPTYKRMANVMAKLCRKYGALEYKECVGDDMRPKGMGGMRFRYFPEMAKTKKDEVVVFAFVVYKSKKHRGEVLAKVMSDPLMNDPNMMKGMPMPFDMKKMAYGGFNVIVDA